MNIRLILILLFFCLEYGIAQPPGKKENGNPFIRNFTAIQYQAHAQNFAITADRNGIMYFGNFAGILQYDGEYWQLIPSANTTKISALALDSAGTVYVGTRGEIGTLGTNRFGETIFRSLTDSSSQVARISEVFQILTTPEGVFFLTKDQIIVRANGKLETWKPETEIMAGYFVNGNLYLQLKSQGLFLFRDRHTVPVGNGNLFAGAIEIKAMLPYPENQILIASGTQGLYLLDQGGIRDFDYPCDAVLQKSLLTCGVRLTDGTYAFGTPRQGIIIIYPDGTLKQIIGKKASLQNESVQALFTDRNNILWAALNNGISLIEIPDQLTYFDDKSGLNGGVNDIIRFKERLFVSTYQGLFWFDDRSAEFIAVPEILTASWDVIPYGDELLTATSQGVFKVTGNNARLIKEGFSMSIVRSSKNPSLILVGEMGGLFSLRQKGDRWVSQKLDRKDDEITDLMEDSYGKIWGVTLGSGILRYSPESGEICYFDKINGLPETAGTTLNMIDGKLCVATRKGVFFFDDQADKFMNIRFTSNDTVQDLQWFSVISETALGDLWVIAGDETRLNLLKKSEHGYLPMQTNFLPVSDLVLWAIYPEPSGVTWFGGPNGLIRFDPGVPFREPEQYSCFIRQINTHSDSLISPAARGITVFPYQNNSLHFEYSTPFYSAWGDNQYQHMLEGFEETWSDWSTLSRKEYTNLPRGTYLFRVRARNIYNKVSTEATFSFRILSPWYATGWAYFIYALIAAFIIYLIVVFRNRQLLKEKRVLEQKIHERTSEVVQQKEEIEKQSEELANKNDEFEKINIVVKAINSEINFANLLQSLLEKTRIIKSVEKSTALIYDENLKAFKFKASFGYDVTHFESVILRLPQAEKRYLKNSEEIFEDIFLKTDFTSLAEIPALNEYGIPKSMLVLVIRVEKKVEAFLILENMSRENAFEDKDLSFIRNSKEHIISAFIKTRILEDLQSTLDNLKSTQDQLIQSEKLASLGALTAGIAHEIQNPLNFVNNFSSLSSDLADELNEFLAEIKDKVPAGKYSDAIEVLGLIQGNVKKIHEHGKRAESIVKGMLQHSRGKSGEFEEVEINNMVTEYVNLAYHGMRAKDKSFNTSIKTSLDPEVGKAFIVPQDLSRVILNIVNNSCYALDEKTKKHIPGFSPEVVISTRKIKDKIEIIIRDNGTGIPVQVMEKIFTPFFTTKPTGKGTGLGLSMSYDIVTQLHKGKLEVKSKEGEFTEFIITIPEKQM